MHSTPITRLAAAAALALGLASATASTADPTFWRNEWPETDFTTTTVRNWVEILSGGPPKDGIPALDAPQFQPVAAETTLVGREPVLALELDGATPRAYPLRYLTWHEIVNDTVEGRPVAVTFCPLCNSAPTFDRQVGDRVLSFGVTGKLRFSDMIMYDRETQSWWQQTIGTAIVGEMTGTQLTSLPSWIESWDSFARRNPEGLVMRQPDYPRSYGTNPYRGYDTSARPFLYSGDPPPHGIAPLARVVRVGDRAWPLERLQEAGEIREYGLRISWAAGTASALDSASIAQGRDIGTIRVRDAAGQDVVHDVIFAFVFGAFWPEGDWVLAPPE